MPLALDRPYAPPPEDSPPSVLLRPRHAVVPFHGRDGELAQLTSWYGDGTGIRVGVLVGQTGAGKTRLAAEFAHGRANAGFLARDPRPDGVEPRALVVVDDAPDRAAEIAGLLDRLAASGTDLRLLLIAPDMGDWWFQISGAASHGPPWVLAPVPIEAERRALFNKAVAAFGGAPAGDEDLDAPLYGSPLFVEIDALLRARGISASPDELGGALFELEERHWHGRLEPEELRRGLGIAWLTGAQTEAEFAAVLDPELAQALAGAYSGADEPKLFADALVGTLLATHATLAAELVDVAQPERATRMLTVLARAARRHRSAASALIEVLASDERMMRIGFEVAQATEPPTGAILAAALARAPNPELAHEFVTRIPERTMSLADLRIVAERQLIDAARARPETEERDASVAEAERRLSTHLSRLRRFPEALAASEESTRGYRKLATDNPGTFDVHLARALTALSDARRRNSQTPQAIAAATESVERYRAVAGAGGDVEEGLANALHMLAEAFDADGRPGEALDAIAECVTLVRELVAPGDDMRLSWLATSLSNQSRHLAGLSRAAEALPCVEEAVTLFRGLAARGPDHRYDLTVALEHEFEALAALSRHDEALATIEEVVHRRRELVEQRPEYTVDLVSALGALGNALGLADRHDEALAALEEAVDIGRGLSDAAPNVCYVGVAVAVANYGMELSRAGREAEAQEAFKQADAYRRGEGLAPRFGVPRDAPVSTRALGRLLFERGETEPAERWYRERVAAGHADAIEEYARLLADSGDVEAAERWYREFAETGDMRSAASLALSLTKRGEMVESERWLRVVADAGNLAAELSIGRRMLERGEQREAERRLERAARGGVFEAAKLLGLELAAAGRDQEAEPWLRQGMDAGDAEAAINLALVLARRAADNEAERILRREATMGTAPAHLALAQFLSDRDRHEEAEPWASRAADAGFPGAAALAATLAERRGDRALTERRLGEAAAGGDSEAAATLGTRLVYRGERLDEAEHLLRLAAEAGSAGGATSLGYLLASRGEEEEAEGWYRRAAAAGNVQAAVNLAYLYVERQDLPEAEHWFAQAAEAGDGMAAYNAGQLANARGDERAAAAWIERATKLGYAP